MLTLPQFAFVFAAAVAAGSLNAVAGGGSFFTFPSLLFVGVPSISANATNTIALWPGVLASISAYRGHIRNLIPWVLKLGAVCLIGGGLGAVLLLRTEESTFNKMIPFLLLLATVIFASSATITRWLRSRKTPLLGGSLWLLLIIQFVIAVYGGYFGGGIGIMMLALLSVSGFEDMNQMNTLKLIMNSLINGVAVITFIVAGAVHWPAALVMIVGAILGGYGGALIAQRVEQLWVRRFVVFVGIVLTIYFFFKYY